MNTTRRVWFHRTRAGLWVALTLVALKWWPESVAFVIIASGYANAISDWTAGEAADNRDMISRLQRIETALQKDH